METRAGRSHYLQVLKEMEYIKGVPSVILLPNMIEWVLSCEIKRQKSKNINGTLTRQMREYLIKLYCTIGEMQKQKEKTEAGELKKQLDEMKKGMLALQEENKKLREELEQVKKSVKQSYNVNQREGNGEVRNNKDTEKDTNKVSESVKSKDTPLLPGTPMESRDTNVRTRRELRYPSERRGNTRQQEEVQTIQGSAGQIRRKEKGSVSNRKRKSERLKSIDHSARKGRGERQQQGENQTEL